MRGQEQEREQGDSIGMELDETLSPLELEAELRRPEQQQSSQSESRDENESESESENKRNQVAGRSLADTKFWAGSNEFYLRQNWQLSNGRRQACSLIDNYEILIHEQGVAGLTLSSSSGSAGGLLQAGLRDLRLARDGILFLGTSEQGDPSGDHYVTAPSSKDCTDDEETNDHDDEVAYFAPSSDDASWFNPENWISHFNEQSHIRDFMPDSNRLPCAEDTVILGRSPTRGQPGHWGAGKGRGGHSFGNSFQINFRPSQASWPRAANFKPISNIRVGRLKIGQFEYNQGEFETLIDSDEYANLLWHFDDGQSLLMDSINGSHTSHSIFTIDHSSTQLITINEDRDQRGEIQGDEVEVEREGRQISMSLDEAGSLCSNEQAEIMAPICSFHQALNLASELPCSDPINSTGYCDPICGYVISINMDPGSFKEQLIRARIEEWVSRVHYSQYSRAFAAPRRTAYNKYEITIRDTSPYKKFDDLDNSNYDNERARGSSKSSSIFDLISSCLLDEEQRVDKQLTEFLLIELNKPSIRSFYGIKSISVQSSHRFKRNNRFLIWTLSSLSLAFIAIIILLIETYYLDDHHHHHHHHHDLRIGAEKTLAQACGDSTGDSTWQLTQFGS